jgi:DNA-binding CsgD family transcriptional regulator
VGLDAVHAMDALSTAVFFLDNVGRCTRWNAAAEALLREGSLVRMRGGRLVATSLGPGSMVLATSGPTVMRRKDGTVAGHVATHALPSGGAFGGASAVVFVDQVQASRPLDVQQALRAAFGLTPKEAELAVRLADGAELATVAETMGISVGGTRTRLKTIYGKVGVRHQAGVVAVAGSLRRVLGR